MGAVEGLSAIAAHLHEAHVEQDAQVLGHGGLWHLERGDDVADGALLVSQEREDVAPPGFGDGIERVGCGRQARHTDIIFPYGNMSSASDARLDKALFFDASFVAWADERPPSAPSCCRARSRCSSSRRSRAGPRTATRSRATLILRALPVHAPDRLVQIRRDADRSSLSNPIWETIRDRRLFQSAGAWSDTRFNLAQSGEVETARGLWVSGGFFGMLGVRPYAGRLIMPADDRRVARADPDAAVRTGDAPDPMRPDTVAAARVPPGADARAVAVLSYGFWQRRYGGAPGVLGRTITLDGVPFQIVGVTPPEFFGAEVGRTFDVAVPLAAEALTDPRAMLDERAGWWLDVMARLRPDQSLQSAEAALRAVQPQIRAATLPIGFGPRFEAQYLRAPMTLARASGGGSSDLRLAYETPVTILMVVVCVVLLIACVNLANVLLGRADARRHEMSVRLAIGASRSRLVRQLLIESLLLAACGAALGLLLAEWASRLLVAQLSSSVRMVTLDVPIDWRVLAFTTTVTVAAALTFGLAPAWRATRTAPNDALASDSRGATGRTSRLGAALVSAQVALSLVLVIGAGLFVRTFTALAHAQLGCDPGPLVIVDVNAQGSATPPAGRMSVVARVRDAVRALPGVQNAALSAIAPFAGEWVTGIENPPGLSLPEDARLVYANAVGPEWFKTYGLHVEEGRALDAEDALVKPLQSVVINETAARRFFPGRAAVGQVEREPTGPKTSRAWTIVGVVDDAAYDSVRDSPPPTMYEPLSATQAVTHLNLTVRAAAGSPEAYAKSVIAAATAVDPRLTMIVQPLEARVAAAMLRERLLAWLSAFFGTLALLLAGLGIYGVVSYDASRRRREIGIRMALGARASSIVALLGRRVAWLAGCGLGIGVALGYWCAQFVSALLFGVTPRDGATFVAASAVLAAVAGVAAWLPARRATRLDPPVLLREG